MRILVLGAGATGGYFGGRLAQAGADVTFLVREKRAQELAQRGLSVTSPRGDFTTKVSTVTASDVQADYDVIMLSCKAYDLASAIDAIRPAAGTNACILPLLNGLRHLEDLDQAFGSGRVLGGTCHISVTLADDGSIRHLSPSHDVLTQGPRFETQKAFSDAMHHELSRGGFDARCAGDVIRAMWEKWVLLATMAAMTTLMRADLGQIARTTQGARIVSATLGECCAVAAASSYRISDDVTGPIRALLTDPGSTMAASMLRDLQKGARIETDHIIGDMVLRAGALGVPVPNLIIAFTALQAYQAARAERFSG